MSSTKPIFAYLLCRMNNGTVAKLRTHRIGKGDGETPQYIPLDLSPRAKRLIHNAQRITAPDINGNANQQTKQRGSE